VFEDAIDPNQMGAVVSPVSDPEQELLVEEMRLSCIHGLLICLNRETRIAFILGDVFRLTGEEGAHILGISPTAFRKRVSRGRTRIRNFLVHHCGLIHPENPCHCAQQVYGDIEKGFVDPHDLPFAGKPHTGYNQNEIHNRLKDLKEIARVTTLLRSYPDYAAPEAFKVMVKEFIDSGEYHLLQ